MRGVAQFHENRVGKRRKTLPVINQGPLVNTVELDGELLADEGFRQAAMDCRPLKPTARHGADAVELNFCAYAPGAQIQADTGQVVCVEVPGDKLTRPLEPFVRRGVFACHDNFRGRAGAKVRLDRF